MGLNGNEKYFYVSKTKSVVDNNNLVFTNKDGDSIDFCTATLISESLRKKMRMVISTIQSYFGIPIREVKSDRNDIIKTIEDDVMIGHHFQLAGWDKESLHVRKDKGLLFSNVSYDKIYNYIKDRYGNNIKIVESRSPQTNCLVYDIYTVGKINFMAEYYGSCEQLLENTIAELHNIKDTYKTDMKPLVMTLFKKINEELKLDISIN